MKNLCHKSRAILGCEEIVIWLELFSYDDDDKMRLSNVGLREDKDINNSTTKIE